MKSIPRRSFIKQTGGATAFGVLGKGFAAPSARLALIADPADPLLSSIPVKWALGELLQTLQAKGAPCVMLLPGAGAGEVSMGIVVSSESALPREGFRLAPSKISGKPGLRVSASDTRGYVYALTELADRVRHGADPIAALTLAGPVQEQPANTVRSIARAFVDY